MNENILLHQSTRHRYEQKQHIIVASRSRAFMKRLFNIPCHHLMLDSQILSLQKSLTCILLKTGEKFTHRSLFRSWPFSIPQKSIAGSATASHVVITKNKQGNILLLIMIHDIKFKVTHVTFLYCLLFRNKCIYEWTNQHGLHRMIVFHTARCKFYIVFY